MKPSVSSKLESRVNKQQRILSRVRAKLGIERYNVGLKREDRKGRFLFPDDTTVFNFIDNRRDESNAG